MPQNKKSAAGSGSIRKKTINKNGKPYTYWEARYTEGYDPPPASRFNAPLPVKPRRKYPRS